MRSGLQNVEVDITVRTGREDAEQQATVVGNSDSCSVKHEVAEHQERSHPTFSRCKSSGRAGRSS